VPWLVYVLVSRRGARTYVGIAIDVPRRLGQHNGLTNGGAKATRAFRPWRLGIVHGPFASRGEAQRVEHRIKKLRGRRRLIRVDGIPVVRSQARKGSND
jgi:structure-specific endonuclease subunit SLX1